MSSLLVKASKLVLHAGMLALGSAQACIDLCCGAVQWYCCWLSSDRALGSRCQTSACSPGLQKSGPHPDEPACTTACADNKYYCCLSSSGDMNCRLGGCLTGETVMAGPYANNGSCMDNCSTEVTGACCPPEGANICGASGGGDCVSATSYWAKNECGVCVETQAGPGDYWSRDDCHVYGNTTCDEFGSGGGELGWRTKFLCDRDGRLGVPCQNGIYAYQCSEPGYAWHPNKVCYEVPCPSDCNATGNASACQGSSRPYAGDPFYCLFYCEEPPEAEVTISGAAIPVVDNGYGGDRCAFLPVNDVGDPIESDKTREAYEMLRDLLNGTFILSSDPATGECFKTITVYDTLEYTFEGENRQWVAAVTVSVLPTTRWVGDPTEWGSPSSPKCGKDACFTVSVVAALISCPNADWPACSGGINAGQMNCESTLMCANLEEAYQKACSCTYDTVYRCSASGMYGQFDNCWTRLDEECLRLLDDATVSLSIS